VLVETWERWREPVEAEGLGFVGAQEYVVFPRPEDHGSPFRSTVDATRALAPLMEEFRPDAVVSDILTLAPALAAEVAGVPTVTLIPHLYPVEGRGLPVFAVGARPARTPVGRVGWRLLGGVTAVGLRRGREELNQARELLGLPPLRRFHGGISDRLALVATFPQLEFPRRWPTHVKVTGPMTFELPYPDLELPDGDEPLILVTNSTAQDPECELVRSSLAALAEEPVRVIATTNGHRPQAEIAAPANARLVDWLSYGQVMPRASLVICHGGHGTVVRALGEGVPVLASPEGGDMAENGARLAWSRTGLMLPKRWRRPSTIRWAVRRILRDSSFARRAAAIAGWSQRQRGPELAAVSVERLVTGDTRTQD
jgi:UDP:flavonoid glycosyltransferase YjiC (YdhE family)